MSDVQDPGFVGMRFAERAPHVPRVDYGADDDTPTLTYRISERAANNIMTILSERATFGLGGRPVPAEEKALREMAVRFKRKLATWADDI